MQAPNVWTDDRVQQLKRLWGTGLSASQIAAEMDCGISRGAVIGKANRLGLSGRTPGVKPGSIRKPRDTYSQITLRPVRSRIAAALAQAVAVDIDPQPQHEAEIIPFAPRCALVDLTDTNCHWPIGEPNEADFHFCGGKALDGVPYCARHVRLAYQPSSVRARQNPKPMNLRHGGSNAWR